MRADSQDGKMAPDSHLRIYHLQTRQFGMLSCKKQTSRSIQLHQVGWISTFKGIPSLVKWSCYIKNKCHTYETLRLWPLNLFTLKKRKLVDTSCLIKNLHAYLQPCTFMCACVMYRIWVSRCEEFPAIYPGDPHQSVQAQRANELTLRGGEQSSIPDIHHQRCRGKRTSDV